MADEVGELAVPDVAAAAVRLDHVHLVGLPGVDVVVFDLGDGGVGAEGAHGAAAAPVAVNVLHEYVLGRTLDCHAF